MSLRLALIAAGIASLTSPAAAQIATGPLGLVDGARDVSAWVSAPVEAEPGVTRLWWVALFHPTAASDGLDRSFGLYEVRCDRGDLRRIRYELHAGDRVLSAYDEDLPWRTPVERWADPQVVAHACGASTPTVFVPDVATAATYFQSR